MSARRLIPPFLGGACVAFGTPPFGNCFGRICSAVWRSEYGPALCWHHRGGAVLHTYSRHGSRGATAGRAVLNGQRVIWTFLLKPEDACGDVGQGGRAYRSAEFCAIESHLGVLDPVFLRM